MVMGPAGRLCRHGLRRLSTATSADLNRRTGSADEHRPGAPERPLQMESEERIER